jgi:hypothetical protein
MGFIKNIFKKKDEFADFEEDLNEDVNTNVKDEFKDEFKDDKVDEFSHGLGRGSSKVGASEDVIPPSSYGLSESPLQSSPARGGTNEALSRNLELINAKLDAIKSAMETMNMKIEKIERIAEQESK